MPPSNSSGPVPPPNGVARISGAFRARVAAPAAPEQPQQAPVADGTRISEALSGPAPQGPPSVPPAAGAQPVGAGRPPQSAGPNGFAPPAGPQGPNPDLESTSQHAAVPPAPGAPERTKVVAGVAAEHVNPQALQRPPQGPPPGGPAQSQQADAYDDYAAFDEYDDYDDYDSFDGYDGFGGRSDNTEIALADPESDAGERSSGDEVAEIDATLARFSAVHDQIATEEAQRRKKYQWLFGMRREPELGRDIPFDFVEGRDAGESRTQWKKQARNRHRKQLMIVLAIVAVVLAGIIALVAL
jgi:hypothetical protein